MAYTGIGFVESIPVNAAAIKTEAAPTYHDDCLIATLKTILKNDAKTDVPFKFCSLSKLDFKAECYEIVGIWIKTFLYPNQQEWERECAKAPDIDYVINCINANPETSVTAFEPVYIYNIGK